MLIALLRDWLLDPLGLLFVWTGLLAWWFVARPERRARRGGPRGRATLLVLVWWAGLAVMSAPALVNPLVAWHEGLIEPGECDLASTIVVLGGGIDSTTTDADRFEAMSSATLARVAEAARLALRQPGVPIIVSGGAWASGQGPSTNAVTEADVMARLLQRLGVPSGSIVRESRSTTTATNVARIVSSGLIRPTGQAQGRLVTSALHMPRALASFEAAGVMLCPVPVERLAIDAPWWTLWPQRSAMEKFDRWLHEQLALVLYRLRGDA